MTAEVTDPRSRRLRHATRVPGHRALAAVLSLIAAVAGFGFVFVETSLDRIDGSFTTQDISALLPQVTPTASPDPEDAAAGQPLNILLLGSDTRLGDDNQALGGGDVGGMRNDTTIVMHISADRSRIEMISIPRDSRVAISDCRMLDGSTVRGWTGKFNIAFANGGQNGNVAEAAACVATTLYDLLGLEIDHYAVVDMEGFTQVVDALGGVPMCIPNAVRSSKAHLDLEAGPQVLDGTTALAWARARTGTGLGDGSDLMRIDRQQELLTNIARKALGLNLLTDATKGTAFVTAVAESLTMDPEFGSSHYLLGLAWSLRNFDTENLYMTTIPWRYPGDGTGDVVWVEDEAQAMFDAIMADEPIAPEENTDDASPTPSPSASVSASATPSATPTPVRETQQDILDACVIDE